MKERTYTICGVAPLLMHNARLTDPLDKWTKLVAEISKKRSKTEEDLLEMSRREWFGGLYTDEAGHPIIPENWFEAMVRDGAKTMKRGKDVQSGCIVPDPAKIEYEGPKKPDAMWESGKFLNRSSCKVGQQRVIRSRPMFTDWKVTFTVVYDENVVNASDLDRFVEIAGRLKGLGDWRPKHGRFEVEKVA